MRTEETAVLVVGGSLVGLSAAMFLAWHGTPVTLVERHPDSSPHPRAIGFTHRTMELLRQVGLTDRVPEMRREGSVRRIRVESLAGARLGEIPFAATPPADGKSYSPCGRPGLVQDKLEPVLRERARELGADLRLATELTSWEQDEHGVRAVLTPTGGEPYAVHAQYLVAADGSRSGVREQLGVGRTGPGHIGSGDSVIFLAPLDELLADDRAHDIYQFAVEQPHRSSFVTTYADGRWVLFGDGLADADEATLVGIVREVAGVPEMPVEIVTTGRWEVSAHYADRFADGRVFLAGDAAHTVPPNRAGMGVNPGIEDVHNLAWKLAAVVAGTARPELLDTYDAERRPVAALCQRQLAAEGAERSDAVLDGRAVVFGLLYRSAAVVGAGPELPQAQLPDAWAGQPGTRAPHVPLSSGGSTLDLFGRDWVLVTADAGWAGSDLPVTVETITPDLADVATVLAVFGIGAGGASLVRPDGYVAWRSVDRPAEPAEALREALDRVFPRSPLASC